MDERKIHKEKVLLRLFLLSFCFAPFSIFSQADTTKDKTELSDFYFAAGGSSFPVFSISQVDFKKIVPASQILSGDIMTANFNDFNRDSAGGYSVVNSNKNTIYAQAGITLRLRNKEFKGAGPWVKLGLNYFSSCTFLNTGVFKKKTVSIDSSYFVGTLPVTSTTVNAKHVSYEYSCQSINLEGTLIYKLNPSGIFSLFGGPGLLLGVNFDGKAKLIETNEITVKDYLVDPGLGQVLNKNDYQKTEKKENFSLAPNLCFGLFINIGIDMRLGINYEYIKKTHLFAEVKPMFRNYSVKGVGLQGSVILVANLGLRYEL